jgi:hypothetical protein
MKPPSTQKNLNQLKHHNVSAAYKAIERDSEIPFLGSPELLEIVLDVLEAHEHVTTHS